MFITHTTTQMPMITLPNSSPNWSIFWPSGVFSSSSFASITACWIFPISVSMPVRVTSAIAWPFVIIVPANTMFTISAGPQSSARMTSGF